MEFYQDEVVSDITARNMINTDITARNMINTDISARNMINTDTRSQLNSFLFLYICKDG